MVRVVGRLTLPGGNIGLPIRASLAPLRGLVSRSRHWTEEPSLLVLGCCGTLRGESGEMEDVGQPCVVRGVLAGVGYRNVTLPWLVQGGSWWRFSVDFRHDHLSGTGAARASSRLHLQIEHILIMTDRSEAVRWMERHKNRTARLHNSRIRGGHYTVRSRSRASEPTLQSRFEIPR